MLYTYIYILLLFVQADPQISPDASRLSLFKEKVMLYCERDTGTFLEAGIPVDKPDIAQYRMPTTSLKGYMEDHNTGLQYYPHHSVLVDPETKFSYDLNSFVIIDLENKTVAGSDTPLCSSTDDRKKRDLSPEIDI